MFLRTLTRSILAHTVLATLTAAVFVVPAGAEHQPEPKEPAPKAEEKKGEEPLPLPLPPRPANSRIANLVPPLELVVGSSEGHATPWRRCSAYANGGNINVTQPNPTTMVITMTGLAAAKSTSVLLRSEATYQFDLNQCFDVVFNSKDVKAAKLTLEGRVLGRLRSICECPNLCRKGGTAEITTPGSATISACDAEILAVHLPTKSVGCCDSQTVYDHDGPCGAPVAPGKYTLHQVFGFAAAAPCSTFVKGAIADFSQDIFLEMRQFGFLEPFVGSANRDFGFTVTVKLIPE